MRLKEIIAPIKDDVNAFEKVFKDHLKSDIFLVDKVISYLVAHRGKRLRPIMVLLSSRLNGSEPDARRLHAAAIIELLHTATLVHDDVVDDSYQRRGFPSINAIWKNKISVLTGDYLFSKSLLSMLKMQDFKVFDVISRTAERMSQGELLQMERSSDYNMEEQVYFRMIGDKTASLISAACQLGVISASANEKEIAMMAKFGEDIGLAFQIRDDLLDLLGTEKKIGKPIGNDLRENKITLPLLHALRNAEKSERRQIIKMMKKGAEKKDVLFIVDFIKKNDGIQYATEKAATLTAEASASLDYYPDSKYKQVLLKLVDFITSREH
ncbi:MAG: polyprenyl synthetase family protein [Deferribacteres bacterium]|nr:polyprenyl synthetase family protein [candidate division KSB1 bacterium]MCB9500791.1 polyprenyl synthetase family protein [Deferribacteres bacterium]